MFDNVICVGVFDATYQDKAMNEFLRVTKPGGLIYFSEKIQINLDDEAAYAAEVGARNKQHPNYFTRTGDLIKAEKQGHEVAKSYFFDLCHELSFYYA